MVSFCIVFFAVMLIRFKFRHYSQHNYRPPTKLREVNVFSHVCLLVSHSVLRGIPVRAPAWCPLLYTPPPPDMFKLAHYGAQTVDKRAVGIPNNSTEMLSCLQLKTLSNVQVAIWWALTSLVVCT